MPGHPKNPRKYVCSRCGRGFSSLAHIISHRCVQKEARKLRKKKGK